MEPDNRRLIQFLTVGLLMYWTRVWHVDCYACEFREKWTKNLVQLYLLGTCCLSGRPALSRSCRLTKAVHNTSLFKHTAWKLKCSVTHGKSEKKCKTVVKTLVIYLHLSEAYQSLDDLDIYFNHNKQRAACKNYVNFYLLDCRVES